MAKAKTNQRTIPEGKTSYSGNMDTTTFDKLKTIAMAHGKTQSEVYQMAFDKFIELYEKKNGPIDTRWRKDIKL
jgi:hypothetical protein